MFRKKLLSLLMIFPLLWSCSRDRETAVVDFADTVPIERAQRNPREDLPLLRVAVGAMISPKETFIHYQDLLTYLGRRTGRTPEFIQRKTYGEINELLGLGLLDIALICTGPYATGKGPYGFRPLAVPLKEGGHSYQSYLIVMDQAFQGLEDLKGRTFAFTDPESNTGKLVPTYWLAQMGVSPERYFSKIIYTYSHDNSILAVSRGLVDGAAVDSLIWEHYEETHPAMTALTRVIKRSEPYPIPPIVASRFFPEDARRHVAEALLSMHEDPEGRRILEGLRIERFMSPPKSWYEKFDRIGTMLAFVEEKVHGFEKP